MTGIVRWTKIALPSAVGVLIAVLALAPLDKKGDVSFILDKKKVQSAPERMRVEAARYTGTDDKGQQFVMTANRAIQPSSDTPLVDIRGMFARLNLDQGPLLIAANQGRYNIDTQRVAIDGPVKVAGDRRLPAQHQRRQRRPEAAPAREPGPGAGRDAAWPVPRQPAFSADLGEHKVVLDGGARLKIVQGAVR